MKKNFVLDTNVLLHDASALTAFEDNCLNIPISVIEEIDHFKKNLDARQLAFEIYGAFMAFHLYHRLLRDPKAHTRATEALEQLLSCAR